MEILNKFDSWDYLSLAIFAISLWLIAGGAHTLKRANAEMVNEEVLKKRAICGIAVSVAYLMASYFAK